MKTPAVRRSCAAFVTSNFLWPAFSLRSALRRKETLSRVGIFYFGSGRKTPDVNVTTVWRKRTGNQALFSGHGNSIRQIALFVLPDGGCHRHADVIPIRRRRGRSRTW